VNGQDICGDSEVPTIQLSGSARYGVAKHLMSSEQMLRMPQKVRLGRKRPKARPQALALAHYLDLSAVSLPPLVDYSAKAMQALSRMYMNDRYGCCVIAGKYHIGGVLTGNESGTPIVGTDQEVYQQYQSICGPGDNGCVITDVLDVFRTRGLPFGGKAHKIDGYVSCNWTNKDLVKAALYLFGNLTLGVNLPDAWTKNDVWDTTSSQIVGGHDVCAVGYNDQGVTIASWGRLYLITWQAFTSRTWLEELYVLLGPDWYGADNLAPNGVNVSALKDDLAKISGGNVPPIDPTPIPPPTPVPPSPVPTPPPAPTPTPAFTVTFARDVPPGVLVRLAPFISKRVIKAGKYLAVQEPPLSSQEEFTAEVSQPEGEE
jgi:hypothetical protein